MFLKKIFTPGLGINSYLIGDEKTKKCAVIDPTRHVIPYIMEAQNNGLEITEILETHVHADFVSGAKELKHQLNERPQIYVSGMGGKEWIPSYADKIVMDGMILELSESLHLKALHTPGHTPEHLTWILYDYSRSSTTPWFAFTGDSLFVGSVGRPDLLGEKEKKQLAEQLYDTLFERMAFLPDFLEIYPGHGEGSLCGKGLQNQGSSTLGYERRFNPYLKKVEKEQWIERSFKNMPAVPTYFQRVKEGNLIGFPLLCDLKTKKDVFPDLKTLFLVDIRHPELFAAAHVKDSLNIPLSHSFVQWAGWLLPEKQPLGLIIENSRIASDVVDQIRLMGFDQEIFILPLEKMKAEKKFKMMECNNLEEELSFSNSPLLIDVRSEEEWKSINIEKATHHELQHLEHFEFEKNRPIVFICKSGNRASTAASLFEKKGYTVLNVRGGMEAWKLYKKNKERK